MDAVSHLFVSYILENSTPQDKPEPVRQRASSDNKAESPKEKVPPGGKLLLGPKPFVQARDRTATGTVLKPVPHPRERTATAGAKESSAPEPPAKSSESKEEKSKEEPKPTERTPPRGPPKFGVGFGGAVGGGLLAEMKQRQERGSTGRVRT